MFQKLHRQMTFFCTLITGIILLALTAACLIISERGIKKNNYTTFLNDTYSILANLENQSLISYEWLARMENNGKYIVHLSNNGQDLLFDELKQNVSNRDLLIREALQAAADEHYFSFETAAKSTILTESLDFTLSDSQGGESYVSLASIPKNGGYIGILIIYPLDSQSEQIFQQRLLFGIFDVIGLVLLCIFSYFFTWQMIKPLQESKEKQTQFIASASHELRTPLAVILSSLSALKKANEEEAPRFTQAIHSESLRMNRLVDDLLLLASADNHSWNLQSSQIEMDTLMLDVYEKFEPVARPKKLRLAVDLPEEELPLCSCDPARIEQVLSILLDNAISYTPENGKIRLSLSASDTKLILRVADTGPGVPDEHKKQIFERFYRAEKSHTQKKHFGLGLCIAQEIIKLHSGKVRVEDTPGGGATFIVELPV